MSVCNASGLAIARSCAMRWCSAMGVGPAVEAVLTAKLTDLCAVYGPGILSGATIDRLGIQAVKQIAMSPEVTDRDVARAREVLEGIGALRGEVGR